ncbi:tRNA dihydrouridine synthase DusB [soil metagenome]
MSIQLGELQLRNPVFLAPMSGISDEPFRDMAHANGAGLVVSEMVASRELVEARPDMVRRAKGAGRVQPFAMQLAGRETRWMSEGAKFAQDLGADIIDINMGCPARTVTGGLSGSALMRDLDHAVTLIEATVAAVHVPVTLKMRLGWDAHSMNAPELARRAEAAGVAMITVHGRTRCQFYTGKADWAAIRAVRETIRIPLIANGDVSSVGDARTILAQSGADGVMIGRGAYGRPWWPGVIANMLVPGSGIPKPGLATEYYLLARHHEKILTFYGEAQGNRIARKHLGWAVQRKLETGHVTPVEAQAWRQAMLQTSDNRQAEAALREFYMRLQDCSEKAA